MSYCQQWGRRFGQAVAVFRDPDAGLLEPLPKPTVDPRLDADHLASQARKRGCDDGRNYLYDGWSFGPEGGSADEIREPAYVEELRHRCASAVHEHRDRQRLTEARLADLHHTAREADQSMQAARDRMARIAVREQTGKDDSLRSFLRRRHIDPNVLQLPGLDHPVWEGEAPPMRLTWRVLIVLFLIVVVFEIEHYVAEAYLPLTDLGATTGLLLTGTISGLSVIGPLVSGQLFRNRHATGYDRPLAALTFVLLLPTLVIILGFGLLAAVLFDHGVTYRAAGATVAASQSAALGITPATLVIVFDVVLFLACAMAYIMGLAQRHPFQQAFARSRRLRNRTVNVTQRMGTRINNDYRATMTVVGDRVSDPAEVRAPDREAAIRSAYRAAEDAYYQALIEAVADPTFTQAVMRRRTRPTGPVDMPGADDEPEAGSE